MADLKSCPFCDGVAKVEAGCPDGFFVHHLGHGVCAISEMFTYRHPTEAEAIAAWNRRLPHEAEGKTDNLARPIIGIEYRSAQEVFDIMADRIRSALSASPSSLPDPGVADVLLQNIVNCTHRPNPTDPSRIDVAPGKHREFQHLIERATIYLASLKGGQ